MSGGVPSTGEVKKRYVDAFYQYSAGRKQRTEAEFDRWFAREMAAVWAEGCKAGLDTGLSIAENVHENGGWLQLKEVPEPPVNPYGEAS